MAAEASVAAKRSKKACSSSNQERAQLALRRCGNCRGTRYNARTCKKDIKISSKLDASIIYKDFLFNSNEFKEL